MKKDCRTAQVCRFLKKYFFRPCRLQDGMIINRALTYYTWLVVTRCLVR